MKKKKRNLDKPKTTKRYSNAELIAMAAVLTANTQARVSYNITAARNDNCRYGVDDFTYGDASYRKLREELKRRGI